MSTRIKTAGVFLSATLALATLAAPMTASAAEAVDPTGTTAAPGAISQQVMDQIYEEVKTPYDYGIVIPKGDQIADFDSELTDQMNVFRIPGDNEYVYTTYVGKDINRKTDGTDNTGYSTGLARSKDMLTWEKLGKILSPDKDFYSASTAGYLVKEHNWGDLPTPHKTADGKYALTVLSTNEHGYEQGDKRGGVAFSDTDSFFNADGSVAEFTMHDTPILDGSASYEHGTIWAVKTIWDAENQRYVAFYNASHGPEVMNQAYSTDLINWTRETTNPVLNTVTQPDGEKWGTLYNGDADTVKIGDYWVMFYFTDTPVKIGNKVKPNNVIDSFAVSKDMVHWTKSEYKLTAKNTTYAKSYAHKPAVVKKNGVVYHYYNAVANQDRNMALSTSIDLSIIKEAKYVLSNSKNTLLSNLLTEAQKQLIRDGGSLQEVTTALNALKMYLHPEADAALKDVTVTYNADGTSKELALTQSDGTYTGTLPAKAHSARLYATAVSSSAKVSVNGAAISPAGGLGIDLSGTNTELTPYAVKIDSADATSSTDITVKLSREIATDATDTNGSDSNTTPGTNVQPTDPATGSQISSNTNTGQKVSTQNKGATTLADAQKTERASGLAHTGSNISGFVWAGITATILGAGLVTISLKKGRHHA